MFCVAVAGVHTHTHGWHSDARRSDALDSEYYLDVNVPAMHSCTRAACHCVGRPLCRHTVAPPPPGLGGISRTPKQAQRTLFAGAFGSTSSPPADSESAIWTRKTFEM